MKEQHFHFQLHEKVIVRSTREHIHGRIIARQHHNDCEPSYTVEVAGAHQQNYWQSQLRKAPK